MLGQHSGLYTLPEINPFVESTLARFERRANMIRPRTLDGLYRAIAEIEFGSQTEKAVLKAKAWTKEHASWTIVETMNYLAEKVAPRRVIDKSPSTVLSDDAINRAIKDCPDAFFLHLYRHPCATTKSIAKITKFGSGGRSAGKDPEEAWYSSNMRIMKAAPRIAPGQFMSLRGEDVLGNPDLYLTQICEWMGLATTKEDLAAMRHPEKSPYACLGPRSAPFGNDPNFLRNPVFSQREIPEKPLSDPLDWDRDDRFLKPETIAISHQMGYGP